MSKFQAIGVLSIPDYYNKSFRDYLNLILRDLYCLEEGGIDMVLIENEGDRAISRKAHRQTVDFMERILNIIRYEIKSPILIAVLPADYEASFYLAKRFNTLCVWMDALVDKVSPKYTRTKFVIEIDPEDVKKHKDGVKLYAEIQPRNFYEIVDPKSFDQSISLAKKYADALCIVGDNKLPDIELVKSARIQVGDCLPIGISGGLNPDNIGPYIGSADFGVFFSYLRGDSHDGPVDKTRVKRLMQNIKSKG